MRAFARSVAEKFLWPAALRPLRVVGMPSERRALGVDIGGSGIKAGLVDLDAGELIGERVRQETPRPATPAHVASAVAGVVDSFGPTRGRAGWRSRAPSSTASPAPASISARAGRAPRCASCLGPRLPGPAAYLNDADAAGLAEARYGAGRGRRGLVVVVTLGTGIGSALVHDGRLVPNSELGHLEVDGHNAESRAADSARKREELTWEAWAARLTRYLNVVENLLWPELFVLGGGVSKRADEWVPLLDTRTPLELAVLRNNAGIIGAALAAHER
jgi:polyphosphate glucokinase